MFKMPPLPFDENKIKELFSEEQLAYHYGKHHQAYLKKLNELIAENPEFIDKNLRHIILNSKKVSLELFNNAAQFWNHTFFWNSLSENMNSILPNGELSIAIDKKYASLQSVKDKLVEKGVSVFGSGWVWLVADESGGIDVITTANGENPITEGKIPILALDVWEHAYYLDFKNDRKKYLHQIINYIDWRFVNDNYSAKKFREFPEVVASLIK